MMCGQILATRISGRRWFFCFLLSIFFASSCRYCPAALLAFRLLLAISSKISENVVSLYFSRTSSEVPSYSFISRGACIFPAKSIKLTDAMTAFVSYAGICAVLSGVCSWYCHIILAGISYKNIYLIATICIFVNIWLFLEKYINYSAQPFVYEKKSGQARKCDIDAFTANKVGKEIWHKAGGR